MKARMIVSSKTFRGFLLKSLILINDDQDVIIEITKDSRLLCGMEEIPVESDIPGIGFFDYELIERLLRILRTIPEQPIVVVFDGSSMTLTLQP